jgi:hypothetical protein
MVILATMGQKPTGGYLIDVIQVSRAGDTLKVTVRETSPGPACITIQAFTAPAVAVSVPRMSGPVVFLEEAATLSCG